MNLNKCEFFKQEVALLGWRIGINGRRADPDKLKAISEYPKPTTAPHLAQFLGMAKHIADVIPKFAELAAPLNEATKGLDIRKRSQRPPALNWTNECEQAFQKIKDAVAISPVVL